TGQKWSSKRTKSYKSMICGFFCCPKVRLPRLQSTVKDKVSLLNRYYSLPDKNGNDCPQMT
ncbi:hypothetical protein UZS95_09350, partial [Parabacteroides goldsteinii]|uniref:hypothetical protein n=1 Tax=Parabacteroides goldsteinii TaxID=328812 RepID=UPI002AB8E943